MKFTCAGRDTCWTRAVLVNSASAMITLGSDQHEWLETFQKIDLSQWRHEVVSNHSEMPDWYYVGDVFMDSRTGYHDQPDRLRNLRRNKYHYWPARR